MKSKQNKIIEAKYVVNKDELDSVKNEFGEDDIVKVVDEAVGVDGDSVVEYIEDLDSETPFKVGDKVYQYVWANYPDGKRDLGVYDKSSDITYSIDWFKINVIEPIKARQSKKEIKKESYSIKKKTITEMISSNLIDRVTSGDHSLKDNPSLPKLSGEDYLMRMIDDKYESISKIIKVNSGKESVNFTEIIPAFGKDLDEITLFEGEHKDKLIKLAIDIITDEFDLDSDDISFDADIVTDITKIKDNSVFDYSPTNGDDIDSLQAEIDKRRIVNALIQGGGRDLADAFKNKKDDIAEIDTRLYNLYRNIMPIGDLLYFANEDDINAIKTGSLSIIQDGEVPTIIARGVNFPTLLMQLAKGVFELLLGEESSDRYKFIKSKADKSEFESDDIRLGLSIYDKIINKIQSVDPRVKYLVISTMSQVGLPEFHKMMKNILGGTVDGDRHLQQIVSGVINSLTEYDNQRDVHESGYVDESEIDVFDFDDLN